MRYGLQQWLGKRAIIATLAISVMTGVGAAPAFAAAKSTTEAAIDGCIVGGVMGSIGLWGVAILTAPFTGGASLALAVPANKLVAGAVVGCAMGAGERALANELDQARE